MRMTKSRVDDRRVGNSRHQFLDADARQPLPRGKQAVVGRRIQLENRLQMRVVVADGNEHAVALRQMPREYEPVGIELADERDRRKRHPERRASSRRRTVCIAGRPPRIMYASGVSPAKIGLLFGRRTHSSASLRE